MSAISGIYQRDGSFVNQSKLALMIEASAPRGLDGTNYLVKDSVGLAHQMLHTTPEALTEKQPLSGALLSAEMQRTRPLSVVMSEKLQALRAWAADRTVMAN